jgi:hypothetical protein
MMAEVGCIRGFPQQTSNCTSRRQGASASSAIEKLLNPGRAGILEPMSRKRWNSGARTAAMVLAASVLAPLAAGAAEGSAAGAARRHRFLDAKTCFQTNVPYDPRIAIAVDAVIVHRHGEAPDRLARAIGSWKERGYIVGRMFFADSDATNAYWKGKWDGAPHPDDVERNAKGEPVLCAGVRPYMVPTEGWTRHLEEMARVSVEAGADAVLPEEPLAHADTGYEKSFRALYEARYKRPWEPVTASPEARFLSCRLKNELFIELERRLATATRERAAALGRDVAFVLPVHGLYSNVAAKLVAPLGTAAGADWIDGWIGQVWTGPVNWALVHYGGAEKSFFSSACVLYDSFRALSAGSGKRLWLLVDPVEDDPNHSWADFETWYRHCVAAMLLARDASSYEVMPWPDRIFLPGYGTGGSTPAPEPYRISILSALGALQEVPEGGAWVAPSGGSEGIGVAVADTILWEKEEFPPLQGIYGLLLPLVEAGVPAAACIAERAAEPGYLARFRTIVLSFEAWKPLDATAGESLAAWVRSGGSLIVLGGADDLGGAGLWWKAAGFPSPLHHLLSLLGMSPEDEGDRQAGKGLVLRRRVSPRAFAEGTAARDLYFPLLDRALKAAGDAAGLRAPGGFLLRRGPFLVAHAGKEALEIPGPVVDVFDPSLPLLEAARVEPGGSGLFREVGGLVSGPGAVRPRVLHATHRLMDERHEGAVTRAVLRGPAGTPAVVRIFRAGRETEAVTARGADGKTTEVDWKTEGPTLRARFPNDPAGATMEVRWKL